MDYSEHYEVHWRSVLGGGVEAFEDLREAEKDLKLREERAEFTDAVLFRVGTFRIASFAKARGQGHYGHA